MPRLLIAVAWVCVIGLAILSAIANFAYGLQAASGPERWIYAVAGALLDGLKTVLPVTIGTLLASRITLGTFLRALFATFLFLGIGAWSLTCALGLYAMAKSEKVSGSAAQQESYRTILAEKTKAEARLKELGVITRTAEAIEGDIAAAKHDKRWTSSKECGDATAAQSREFCSSFERLKAELETAPRAGDIHREQAELKQARAKASSRLEGMNLAEVLRAADPGVEALARFSGTDPGFIRDRLAIVISLLIEISAGFGAWLITGSHGPQTLRKAAPATKGTVSRAKSKAKKPSDDSVVAQWAAACLMPKQGASVSAGEVRASFEAWCRARKIAILGATSFGKEMTRLNFEREKRGGVQRYAGVTLAGAPNLHLARAGA
jgi:hypothetical protein